MFPPNDLPQRGDHLTPWKGIPDDFHFEIHLDRENKPYTSRVCIPRASHNVMSQIADLLASAIHKKYGINRKYLFVMSSHEEDGIYVWVRSRIQIPVKQIQDAHHNLRLKDHHGLGPRPPGDQIIDI